MVSKNLFNTLLGRGEAVPPANTINDAGGKAYATTKESALAQYAITGALSDTYYASGEVQLDKALELAKACSAEYVGKVAIYARQFGYMKDMPALLVAHLSARDLSVFKKVFPIVIDDFKMLRNFVQIVRSGVVGRKSFGTSVKKSLQKFFDDRTDDQIFRGSIGNDPALADIIKMVHPKPKTESRSNLFSYLLGKKFVVGLLPETAKSFELFKNNPAGAPPEINFQFLSNITMSTDQWAKLAESMTWQTLRMNLNTLARNGVFANKEAETMIAKRLADKVEISKAKVFPYQLLAAFKHASDEVPMKVTNALQTAADLATENVPALPGKTIVAVDTSGSMSSPITGSRPGAITKMTCVDVAGLMASTVLRTNEDAMILPFSTSAHPIKLNPRDSVMTNTQKIVHTRGGGTDCASALRYLNENKIKGDNVIFVSDNESWYGEGRYGRQTGMAEEWKKFQSRNPKAKMVCIDITPGASVQTMDSKSVLNIGGFNDRVFDIVAAFFKGDLGTAKLAELVNAIKL